MTPTAVCEVFNDLYALPDEQLLLFRAKALEGWGRRYDDPISKLIALQADYVCKRRGLDHA